MESTRESKDSPDAELVIARKAIQFFNILAERLDIITSRRTLQSCKENQFNLTVGLNSMVIQLCILKVQGPTRVSC